MKEKESLSPPKIEEKIGREQGPVAGETSINLAREIVFILD